MRRVRISEAQANAQAVRRREVGYRADHLASSQRASVVRLPRRFGDQLRLFKSLWSAEVPRRLHRRGVEWEPARFGRDNQVIDPGGASATGSPAFSPEARRHIFGRTDRVDPDGSLEVPLHDAVDHLGRSGHPFLAGQLRRVGYGGDWRAMSVACEHGHRAPLPEEYAEAIIRDAVTMALRLYSTVPYGRRKRGDTAA